MLSFRFSLIALLLPFSSGHQDIRNGDNIQNGKVDFNAMHGRLRKVMEMGDESNYPGDGHLCDQDHNRTRDQMHNCTGDCVGTWSDDGGYGGDRDHPCGNYSDNRGVGPYGNYSGDGCDGDGWNHRCGNYSDDSGAGPYGDRSHDFYGSCGNYSDNHQDNCDHAGNHGCQNSRDSDGTTDSDSYGYKESEQLDYETTASPATMHVKSVGIIIATLPFLFAW
jgi:hypothetical protein